MSGGALPVFDIEGGLLLALVRGLSVASLLSVFGALLFRAVIAPPVLASMRSDADALERRWRIVFWASWAASILTALAWLVAETANISGADTMRATAAALPTVLTDTFFGHVLAFRFLVLLLIPPVLSWRGRGRARVWGAVALATVATALQGEHSHAASMYDGPSLLLLSDIVHLLSAGAWLGGLIPLFLLVAAASPDEAIRASRRFSTMATVAVVLLAITAAAQFWVLIGSLPGLIGTGYGLMALLKLGLFAILLGFAAVNRFRLTPALGGVEGASAKLRLCRSIGIETGLGLLVVLAAGVLTSLPPSMHVQPLWPFAQKLSLDTVREDPDFMREVVGAALALAGAGALLVVAMLARRARWLLVAAAVAIAWFAVPHLSLLLVDAYPTSFYYSPTGFTATTIADGAALFPQHCAVCHGTGGAGDGPAAKILPIPPADLTADHLWMHSDGELFWWLSHGIDGPDGGLAMPGFAATLSESQRWALIDYIHALNAGTTRRKTGAWSTPIQAPALSVTCGNWSGTLDDFHGRFVRLVFGGPVTDATRPDLVTIVAGANGSAVPASACTANDETVARAYAVITGIDRSALPGTQILIDGAGWLRAVNRPDDPANWNDPRALAAAIGDLRAHPISAGTGMSMPMNMKM